MARSGGLRARIRRVPSPRTRRQFTPFQAPTRPPAGFYDPALDAEERASRRGLADLEEDVGTSNLRSRNDFDFATEELGIQRTRGRQDYDFALGGLGIQRQRGTEDYGRQVGELDRSYSTLASRQTQRARAMGTARGGALAQALRKRTANKAWDRQPIDTGFRRMGEDIDRETGRLGTQFTRFGEDIDRETGRLGVEFERDWQDRNLTQLPRARREATEFGLDLTGQRWFQSKQAGYEPPVKPRNEMTRHGLTFQVGGMKKPVAQRTYTLPTGQRLDRGGFVGLIRKRRKQGVPTIHG